MLNNTTTYQNPVPNGQYFDTLAQAEFNRLVDPRYVERLMQPRTIRAIGYVRVSTEKQARQDKVSLTEQKDAVRTFIANNSWQFAGFYEDAGKSGKTMADRDEFQQMLENAKRGQFEVIVSWSTDRLARNALEMSILREQLRKQVIQITPSINR